MQTAGSVRKSCIEGQGITMRTNQHAVYTPRRKRKTARPARQDKQMEYNSANLYRVVACGVIFVALVTLKLLMPGSLSAVRGTLGSWLVRDADFAEAFSAIGHAVSGENHMLDSLENAYVAVFSPGEAADSQPLDETGTDTGSAAAAESPYDSETYPAQAVKEQRILGFDYSQPVKGEMTSGFGWREHPVSGRETFHYGVDLAADEGEDIRCFADGTVGIVANSVELGKYLTVHHENGVITLYAHCSRITVSPGEAVRRGDKLAEAGSTGNATGTHLHFEIQDGEEYLNPIYYLS